MDKENGDKKNGEVIGKVSKLEVERQNVLELEASLKQLREENDYLKGEKRKLEEKDKESEATIGSLKEQLEESNRACKKAKLLNEFACSANSGLHELYQDKLEKIVEGLPR